MYYLFLTLLTLACVADSPKKLPEHEISIVELQYAGRPHLKVTTHALSYYYDIRGGGFSRILDQEGNDWIGFKMEPWGSYPASAASSFRGLPNLVFGQADDGAGHPGHDKCTSRYEGNRIITRSLSGHWEWYWEFHDSHALLQLTRADPDRSFWFLYEGTPGGSYHPERTYFGNNEGGPYRAAQDYYKGDVLWGSFRWIYTGSAHASGTFFMVQEQEDERMDMISFLGNTDAGMDSPDGMCVFGFGREKEATPLLRGRQGFIIGLYPEAIQDAHGHKKLSRFINHLL
jgi:hypothetical protein